MSQVIENAENIVSIKVTKAAKEHIEDVQRDFRRTRGTRLNQCDVVDMWRKAASSTALPSTADPNTQTLDVQSVLKSLNIVAKGLVDAATAIKAVMDRISMTGDHINNASESTDERTRTLTASHAAAAEGLRVASGVLRGLEGATGGAGEGTGGTAGDHGLAEKTTGQLRGARGKRQ